METEESVLKDAISADIKSFNSFNPVDAESMVAFHGGIDGSQSLFDFIKQFDAQFKAKNIETAEMFIPIIEELLTLRNKLLGNLDMIMYYPVLSFGVDEEARNTLIGYREQSQPHKMAGRFSRLYGGEISRLGAWGKCQQDRQEAYPHPSVQAGGQSLQTGKSH